MILASRQPFSWLPLGRTPTLGLLCYSQQVPNGDHMWSRWGSDGGNDLVFS